MAEPFLPPGFFLGSQWYSYDNGLTWEQYPDARRVRGEPSEHAMTVTGVDEKAGTITVQVNGR